MSENRHWWEGFAVEGIQWRRFVDWAVLHLPDALHPALIWIGSLLFFVIAAPARRSVIQHLGIVLPNSGWLSNHLRALRLFANFGWMLADAAVNRLRHAPFAFELEGEECLEQLGRADGAIVLTAHMGNYDLGAAMFAKKFNRQLRMVRAPEPDVLAAQHLDKALHQSGDVRVDYNDRGPTLAFDLLNALREHEIISIQGDRVIGGLARAPVRFFSQNILLPTGPFALSFASEAPIYPLFILRVGFRKYKVVAFQPIVLAHDYALREDEVGRAMAVWAHILEKVVQQNWSQWYVFKPLIQISTDQGVIQL